MLPFALRTFLVSCCGVIISTQAFALDTPKPTTLVEDFARDPVAAGWQVFGDASLFHWDAQNHDLEVTWDSAKGNSYYYRPLGTTLTARQDFMLSFELRLTDIACGTTAGKPYTFELAVGLINFAQASATNFLRGTGVSSPNVVEFDYFPDSGFGATISPTIISSNMVFASSFNAPIELSPGDVFQVVMRYDRAGGQLKTEVTRNGEAFGTIKPAVLGPEFTDFSVDHVAIMSYSDAGQDPQFSGSIRAHGAIDNLLVVTEYPATLDIPLTPGFVNNQWSVAFTARPDWSYALERTSDFTSWTLVTNSLKGATGEVALTDPNPPAGQAQFYRVLALGPGLPDPNAK